LAAKRAYEEARAELMRRATEPQSNAPKFTSLDELNAALERQRQRTKKAAEAKVDRVERMRDIETELDIIRGVVPTPAGYTADRSKVRSLVRELEQLRAA
jgi:hypothetical protein